MNAKFIGIAVLLAVYTAGLFIAGYSYAQKSRGDAVLKSLEQDKEKVQEAKIETKIITKQVIKYVDRIKTIVDKTGCADVIADPDIDDSLHQIYCSTKGCETH